MKKLVVLSMTAMLAASMMACSNDNSATDTKEPSQQTESPKSPSKQTDPDWITPVGETISTEGGDFTFHTRNDQVEPVEAGSLTLDFDQVAGISGVLSPEFAEHVGQNKLEYIQVDIQVTNTSKDPINFDAYQATLITSTGEEIAAPNPKLGELPEGKFAGEEKKQASVFYVLEKSKAEDVEWVRLVMKAPTNESNEKVGEDLDIKVELKG